MRLVPRAPGARSRSDLCLVLDLSHPVVEREHDEVQHLLARSKEHRLDLARGSYGEDVSPVPEQHGCGEVLPPAVLHEPLDSTNLCQWAAGVTEGLDGANDHDVFDRPQSRYSPPSGGPHGWDHEPGPGPVVERLRLDAGEGADRWGLQRRDQVARPGHGSMLVPGVSI
jgi:hypothetical protein